MTVQLRQLPLFFQVLLADLFNPYGCYLIALSV